MGTIWKRKIQSGITFEARVRMNGMDVPPYGTCGGMNYFYFIVLESFKNHTKLF
jgi:hypothetical protein